MQEDHGDGRDRMPAKKAIPTQLSNLEVTSLGTSCAEEVMLDDDYVLKPKDVLCGWRRSQQPIHSGNARFRVLIEMRLDRYRRTSNRTGKIQIVKEVVDAVLQSGGSFVRQHHGLWYSIGTLKAREKAGHAFRQYMAGKVGRQELQQRGGPPRAASAQAAAVVISSISEPGESASSSTSASSWLPHSPQLSRELEASESALALSTDVKDFLRSTFIDNPDFGSTSTTRDS